MLYCVFFTYIVYFDGEINEEDDDDKMTEHIYKILHFLIYYVSVKLPSEFPKKNCAKGGLKVKFCKVLFLKQIQRDGMSESFVVILEMQILQGSIVIYSR